MASLGTRFSAQDHNTSQSSTLPNGRYALEISESDVVDNSKGTGKVAKGMYEVLEPESHAGRKMFFNINIEHENSTTQDIGQRELASLARAIGQEEDFDDTVVLHNRRFVAKVGLEKPSDGYEPKNKIMRFFYPDEGDLPEPVIDPVSANDNKRTARHGSSSANDNRSSSKPASAPAERKASPWGKK